MRENNALFFGLVIHTILKYWNILFWLVEKFKTSYLKSNEFCCNHDFAIHLWKIATMYNWPFVLSLLCTTGRKNFWRRIVKLFKLRPKFEISVKIEDENRNELIFEKLVNERMEMGQTKTRCTDTGDSFGNVTTVFLKHNLGYSSDFNVWSLSCWARHGICIFYEKWIFLVIPRYRPKFA